METPVALTVAGSDSGGGAGIQADLKTFQAFKVFGTSAVTAITVQNTLGVRAVHTIPADIVRGQIHAVASDFRVAAVKTGMLATRPLVQLVADAIRDESFTNYVLDPVMVATSGDRLLDDDAVESIVSELIPICTVITPNLDEAEILTGLTVRDVDGMHEAARFLVDNGANAALIKGGHLQAPGLASSPAHKFTSSDETIDVLYDGSDFHVFKHKRIETKNTHGTGCTLSAAITAGLARGDDLRSAIERALDFVHRAIATAPGLGAGHGPLNHFAEIQHK